ncbi:MAG: hypothetical protein HWD59_11675 [Coxiellaceae bacterium]|nr:MAG: hypothetical protein HWD59_11675 [Coxiellaceae bacterium]
MRLKRNKGYVSEIDKILEEYAETHPKSPAQLSEFNKYQRIYELRDNPEANKENAKLWREF